MKKENIFTIPALYRDDFRVRGFKFGSGEKSLAVVGSLRGNEFQQIYMCSLLVKRLKKLEEDDMIAPGNEILVIPSLNPYSMNIGKRFWPTDNTDINRMFPGYDLGETTQRIAAAAFDVVSEYDRGIQFASFYMPGRYLPHVHIMETGFETAQKALGFGLPYVILRKPRPYDTTTLNYNWQIWETDAFSLYAATTGTIDDLSAGIIVDSVIRYLKAESIVRGEIKDEVNTRIASDDEMVSVRPVKAGIFKSVVDVGVSVKKGEKIAYIIDAYEGGVIEEITSPESGRIFFVHSDPMTYANTAVFKILKDPRQL